MRKLKYLTKPVLAAIVSLFVISAPVFAQDEEQPKRTMFTNVNVWDGSSDSLDMNSNVLVENNKVVSIGSSITILLEC